MTPYKQQPPRLDVLCAARFGRHWYERFLAIERLKLEPCSKEPKRLCPREELPRVGVPRRIVDKYFLPMFYEIYVDTVKHGQVGAIEFMRECLLKADPRHLDMSWLYDEDLDSLKASLLRMVPSLRNLRVLIVRSSATDELLHLLCRHCKHLEELDVSFSRILPVALDLFGTTDQQAGVHGCPNLLRFRLSRCYGLPTLDVARLLKDLKHLEELVYDDMTTVLLDLFNTLPCTEDGPRRGFRKAFQVYRLKGLKIDVIWMDRYPGFVLKNFEGPVLFETTGNGQDQVPSQRLETRPPSRIPNSCISRAEVFLDFIASSCPSLETLELASSRDHLFMLALFPKLEQLSISVPAVSIGRGFASCINSRLTSLELKARDLPSDELVAIGTTCERLKKLRITLSSASLRQEGTYPRRKDGDFRNLEVLHYETEGLALVSKEELLYLMSGATNLVNLNVISNVDFLTDLFWVNFLNVNPLKRLEILQVYSETIGYWFSMGKASVHEFWKNCPDLRMFAASFDPVLLSDEEIEKIRGQMKRENFIFHLSRL